MDRFSHLFLASSTVEAHLPPNSVLYRGFRSLIILCCCLIIFFHSHAHRIAIYLVYSYIHSSYKLCRTFIALPLINLLRTFWPFFTQGILRTECTIMYHSLFNSIVRPTTAPSKLSSADLETQMHLSLYRSNGSAELITDLDEMHGLLDRRGGGLDANGCWFNDSSSRSRWSCATSSSISVRRCISRTSCRSASFRALVSAASAVRKPGDLKQIRGAVHD